MSILCAAGVAGAVVLFRTAKGSEFALERVLDQVRPAINGTLEVGSAKPGGLLGAVTLYDVRLTDALGRPVLFADSIRARYSVMELLGGSPSIADLRLWSPVFTVRPEPGEWIALDRLFGSVGPAADPVSPGGGVEDDTPSPAFKIRGARIHGGTVVMRSGGGAQERVEDIEVDFSQVEVFPERGIYARVAVERTTFSLPVGENRMSLAITGGIVNAGREGVTVEAEEFRLPGSQGEVSAVARREGSEGWRTALEVDFARLSLADLRWLDDRFDRGVASGKVGITISEQGIAADLSGVEVELDPGRLALSGGLALTGGRFSRESIRFDDLRLSARAVPTEEVGRWWPPGLPVTGGVSGEIRVDGIPDRLGVQGWLALVDGLSSDTLALASGGGTLLGPGSVEEASLALTALDYRLVEALVPGFPQTGRGSIHIWADGDLGNGMAVRVRANGAVAGGPSDSVALAGTLFGNAEMPEVSEFDLEATMNPLSFSTVRAFLPGVALSGEARGNAKLVGELARLRVDLDVETSAGHLAAGGVVNARDPAAGYDLQVAVRDFRLSALLPRLPEPTVVSGMAHVTGRGLTLREVRSALVLHAGSSSVGPVQVDSATIEVRVGDDGILDFESVYAEAGGVVIRGQGSLGTAPEPLGEGVILSVSSPSISLLRPLFMDESRVAWDALPPIEQNFMIEAYGVDPDTFPVTRDLRFGGAAEGEIRIQGRLDRLSAEASVTFEALEYGSYSAGSLTLDLTARELDFFPSGPEFQTGSSTTESLPSRVERTPVGVLAGTITADSVFFGDLAFQTAQIAGDYDLVGLGRLRALAVPSERESYEAHAMLRLGVDGGRVDLDRLNLILDDRQWRLREPASFEWSPDALIVNDFGLIQPGTHGLDARADGRLARRDGKSDFEFRVSGLDLDMLGRILQKEDPPMGRLSADLTARGSGERPEWEGALQIEDAEYGIFGFDRITANGSYADRIAAVSAETWTDARRTIRVEGSIPLDLRLNPVENRVLDEPIEVTAAADSFPLAVIMSALNSVEEVGGTVSGTLEVRGRPSEPKPTGAFRVMNGTGVLSPLGVRFTSAQVALALSPDGRLAVDGSARSGGSIRIRGAVDIGQPANPIFDLAFWSQDFQIVDRRDMEAAVSGDSITLTGSYNLPFIQGALDVQGATVFIEEFLRSSEAVNFYDPVLFGAATADGGDLKPPNPFLANLRVLVDMNVGRENRLRSRNMNVETSGDLSVTFDRERNQLTLQGTVEVVRGTYSIPPRTFTMTEGSIRFVGIPGFNPDLSVTTEHRLRTRDGQPLTITANITGTLLSPLVALSSDAEPEIPEADLYSYLLLGQPTSALTRSAQDASFGAGRNLLLGQVASQIGYLLALELNLDHLSVSQAEQGLANAAFGASSLQVEVGKYLLDNIFLTGVYQRGFCADPTLPVSSGAVRVEVGLPRDVTLEGFLEDRCTREGFQGLGGLSLQLAQIWGFSLYREWGY